MDALIRRAPPATLDFAFHDCLRPVYGAPHRNASVCYRPPPVNQCGLKFKNPEAPAVRRETEEERRE
jgi:hypothetical protein